MFRSRVYSLLSRAFPVRVRVRSGTLRLRVTEWRRGTISRMIRKRITWPWPHPCRLIYFPALTGPLCTSAAVLFRSEASCQRCGWPRTGTYQSAGRIACAFVRVRRSVKVGAASFQDRSLGYRIAPKRSRHQRRSIWSTAGRVM
jgi:hypothetical protein